MTGTAKFDVVAYVENKLCKYTESCIKGIYVPDYDPDDVYIDLVEGLAYEIVCDLIDGKITLVEYMAARNAAGKLLWALAEGELS